MFVAIHELAHVMTKSVGHTEEFWTNMKFLLKIAIKEGIYKKQNFNKILKILWYYNNRFTFIDFFI